jgi:heavy metal efflux system protein
MMGPLIQFALSQRLLVMLLTLLLAGSGAIALLSLPIDAFPDISPTQVKVIIKAPGMTPEEVESLITHPIEVELLGIPRQVILRSISKYALTSITLDFEEGTDIYWARQQVNERLTSVWENLPGGISGGLAPISTPLGEMFMFTVENDQLDLMEKRFLMDWTIRPALRTVPGVADVNVLGGYVRGYLVTPMPERMSSAGVSLEALVSALADNNRNDGAGRLDQGEETLLVRVEGAVTSLEDIRNIGVTAAGGRQIPLASLAEVSLGELERYGSVSADGKAEAVQGLVIGLRGANARDVVDAVRLKLEDLEATLPPGTTLPVFYDRRELIDNATGTVTNALLQAVVLVAVLLGLFLGNLRAAITVALVLPLTVLLTFLLMRNLEMSANLMSLGGLAIAIGMLVDSAIVVVENVQSTLARHPVNGRLPRLHLVYRATREVSLPVISGVAIIIIVFLPLLTLEGLEGKLFVPVALTIVFALISALLLSFTVIPVLASLLMQQGDQREAWLSRHMSRCYAPMLEASLQYPRLALGAGAGLLLLAAGVFPLVGKTFMPGMDEGDILIQVEGIPSVSLDASTRNVMLIERMLMERVPEIARIVSRTGSDELGLDPMSFNETDIFLQLRPRSEWRVGSKQALQELIREVMDEFRGVNYGFTQPIDMRVSEMLTGTRGDVAIKLFGPDLDILNEYSQRIARLVEEIPGSIDTIATLNEGAQFLRIDIDRKMAAQTGIDAEAIQLRMRAMLEGLRAGTVLEQGARVPLMVRNARHAGEGVSQMQQLLINLPDGGLMPLGSLAVVERVEGPVVINRELGQRFAVVRTNVAGRDLVGYVEAARQAIETEIQLPEGYTLSWGGEFENQQRAAARLALVIPRRAWPHCVDPVCDLSFSQADPDYSFQHPFCPHWRCAGTLDHWRIFIGAGFCRIHRIIGHCRDEWGCDGVLFQLPAGKGSGSSASGQGRCDAALAAGHDDCHHLCLWAIAPATGHRPWFRNSAATGNCGDRGAAECNAADLVSVAPDLLLHPSFARYRSGSAVNVSHHAGVEHTAGA